MGSLRAALTAGTVPKIIPTATDTPTASNITCQLTTGYKLVKIRRTTLISREITTPMTPPMTLSTVDSTKN